MASLVPFFKKKLKDVENRGQAVVAQVNPLDNNRTYNTVRQRGGSFAPSSPQSVGNQLVRNSAVAVVPKSINTLNAARLNIGGLGRAGYESAFGSDKSYQNVLNDTARASKFASDFGLGGRGAYLTDKQASASGGGFKGLKDNFVKPFANATAEVAPFAVPGAGAILGKGSSVAARALTESALNAGVGGATNAAQQLANTGKLNVKELGKSAALSGAIAGASPVAGAALRKGSKAAGETVAGKPFRNVSDDEITSLRAVSMKRQGYGESVANPTQKDFDVQKNVQKRLKLSSGDNDALDDVINARLTYTNKLQNAGGLPQLIDTRLNPKGLSVGGATKKVTGIADDAAIETRGLLPRTEQQAAIQAPQVGSKVSSLPQSTPQVATSGLTAGAKAGRQNLSPEAQVMVQGEYTVRNTKALDERSKVAAAQLSDDDLINNVSERLTTKLGNLDDETVALTNQAIERAEAAGRTREAVDLHDALSEQLTASGQAAQAASLLYRLSPNGIFYKGLRDLKKAGREVDGKLENQLRGLADNISNATDETTKRRATAILQKKVADSLPRSVSQDLLSIWKAGLLSGVKTQQGNALSNGTFAALKKASDIPSAIADKGISLVTGKRTKTATLRGGISGAKEGTLKGIDTLKTGIDERNITGGKYEQYGELNFKNPIINTVFAKPTNLVFRSMSAADQPFYFAAAKNNLYDLALAQAKTQGLKGSERDTFVQNLVANPSKQMAETAQKAAEKAVLGFDTVASNAIKAVNKSIDNAYVPKAYKDTAHIVVNVLAPFTKVPTAFLSRVIDFTPAGPFKEAIGQISNKQFDQRALSEAIGQGLTGTGVIALGVALTQNDLLSGNYPKNDQKEAQRWKAEGITPNSVKLGNKWVSLNYLGPLGLLLNAGRTLEKSDSPDVGSKIASSIGGLGQGLLGQSFLQGLSGFSDAITDPERNAKSFINSQASSIVPAISNDIANVTDKFQRQADTPLESIKNRLPGLREQNKVKQDVYGNKLSQPAGQLNTLNGVKPSNSLTRRNDVIAEVSRLRTADDTNPDLEVTPTTVNKSISVEGKQVKLNENQKYQLQEKTGQATQKAWGELIKTPDYQKLDDIGKAKALSNLRTDINGLATRQYIIDSNLGTYAKQATKKQVALSDGSKDISDYANFNKPKAAKTKVSKSITKKPTRSRSASARKPSSLKVARIPTIRVAGIKAPKVKVSQGKQVAFKSKRAIYKTAKIQSNISSKLKAKAA